MQFSEQSAWEQQNEGDYTWLQDFGTTSAIFQGDDYKLLLRGL